MQDDAKLISSNENRFGGTGVHRSEPIPTRSEPFVNLPYSAAIDVPPMSAVYYTFKKKSKGRKSK